MNYRLVGRNRQWAGTAGAQYRLAVNTAVAMETTLTPLTVVPSCVVLTILMNVEVKQRQRKIY